MREATLLSSLAISIIVLRELAEKIFGSNMQTIPQEYLLLTPIEIPPLEFRQRPVSDFRPVDRHARRTAVAAQAHSRRTGDSRGG